MGRSSETQVGNCRFDGVFSYVVNSINNVGDVTPTIITEYLYAVELGSWGNSIVLASNGASNVGAVSIAVGTISIS